MTEPMRLDKKATAEARKRQEAGIARLNEAFGVTPLALALAKRPHPKKRGGLSKNRVKVLRRRQAHLRRAVLRSATLYMQREERAA